VDSKWDTIVFALWRRFHHQVGRVGRSSVDNKYFDIPTTMLAAVNASFVAGGALRLCIAQAGREALQQLAQLEKES